MKAAELRHLVPDAPAALGALLAAADGAVLPPIRSEIFGPERFAQHGRSLAMTHEAVLPAAREATFFPRLRSNIAMLRRAHAAIGAQAATGYDISPAAEWLLDNFHLIEAQLKAVHEGLPRSYFRTLPVLQGEPLAGLPRVYGVAWAFVAHTDSAFDEELLVHFLSAYQGTRELSLAEMWALPTTLRVVLVENLRRVAERLAVQKSARELANRAATASRPATRCSCRRCGWAWKHAAWRRFFWCNWRSGCKTAWPTRVPAPRRRCWPGCNRRCPTPLPCRPSTAPTRRPTT